MLPRLARRAGAEARRAGAAARRGAAPREGDAGCAGHARGRQDHPGGPGRGAGDDRHLRLRGRPLPPAVRPDHRVRAPGPPDGRVVAPAGPDRRDHRVQLPGRRLELELRAGIRLRRSRAVEAVVADAADGARLPLAAAARRRALRRCAGRPARGADRRRRPRAGRRPARAAGVGDRLDGDGPEPRPARRVAPRPLAARAGRQQRHDRHADGRPRPGRARHRLLGGRHRRPALHQPAPADRPRGRRRRPARAAGARVRQRQGRRSARAGHAVRAADLDVRVRRHAGRARPRALGRRHGDRRRARARRPLARRPLRPPGDRADARADRRRPRGDVRPAAVRAHLRRHGRGDRPPQRRAPGPVVVHLHGRPPRERAVPVGRRVGLRHRQRQHRAQRRRDRRRVRRREGDGRRPRIRLGRVEGVHAPADGDGQLLDRPAARPGHPLRRSRTPEAGGARPSP